MIRVLLSAAEIKSICDALILYGVAYSFLYAIQFEKDIPFPCDEFLSIESADST